LQKEKAISRQDSHAGFREQRQVGTRLEKAKGEEELLLDPAVAEKKHFWL